MSKKLKIILYVSAVVIASFVIFFIGTYFIDPTLFKTVRHAEVGQEIVLKKGELVKISGTGIVLRAFFVEGGYTSWDRMGPHVVLEASIDGKKFKPLYWANTLGDYLIGDTDTDNLTYIKVVVHKKGPMREQLPE